MIVEALLDLVGLILAALDAVVPAVTMPYQDEMDAAAEWAGARVGFLSPIVPVAELAAAFSWIVGTYLPVWFGYIVVKWVYAHIPVFGQGG